MKSIFIFVYFQRLYIHAKWTRIAILKRNAMLGNVTVKENTSEMERTAEVIMIITVLFSRKPKGNK